MQTWELPLKMPYDHARLWLDRQLARHPKDKLKWVWMFGKSFPRTYFLLDGQTLHQVGKITFDIEPGEGQRATVIAEYEVEADKQDAVNGLFAWLKGRIRPAQKPGAPDAGVPGNPGLDHEQVIANLAMVIEGEALYGDGHGPGWKEVAGEISWPYGASESGQRSLRRWRSFKNELMNEGDPRGLLDEARRQSRTKRIGRT